METILIVEDNTDIHNLIKEILEKEGYKILNAYSGTEALIILEKENVDLILLDLMLPGLNGEEIVKQIKNVPIIVISAKISNEDKVNALINGANDYITKPFNTAELLARVKVQLRMKKQNEEQAPKTLAQKSENNLENSFNINKTEIQLKNLILKEETHTLFINENEIHLTKTEYAILKQLMLNPKNVITKTKILDLISYDTPDCDENSLKVHISNIRRKIRKVSSKEYIEAVWGIGFKINLN